MKKPNQNKIAVVTGGASGLGFAIAEKFVEAGLFTIIIGRDKPRLKTAREKLGELCASISYDLNNLQGIPALVQEIKSQYGAIDILVNNAGINLKKEFTRVTDKEF